MSIPLSSEQPPRKRIGTRGSSSGRDGDLDKADDGKKDNVQPLPGEGPMFESDMGIRRP